MSQPITKETFEKLEQPGQMSVLFDLQVETCDTVKVFTKKTDERLKSLEKPKRVDKLWSLGGGFIGGFCAIAAKLAIWRD